MLDFVGKAVILAGGSGTRLSEETTIKPKPMVEIGGKPILVHIMELYHRFGINEFIVCAGYKGFVIKEYFANFALHNSDLCVDLADGSVSVTRTSVPPWKIHVIDTGEGSMTGGRIARIGSLVKNDPYFYLTYGDGLSSVDIAASRDFHLSHGKQATMTAVRPSARFGNAVIENNLVTHFAEKSQADQGLINGGFFVLAPKVLDLIEGDQTVWEQGPMQQLAASGQLAAYEHTGFWQPMDTLREKHILEELWVSGECPWKVTGC